MHFITIHMHIGCTERESISTELKTKESDKDNEQTKWHFKKKANFIGMLHRLN